MKPGNDRLKRGLAGLLAGILFLGAPGFPASQALAAPAVLRPIAIAPHVPDGPAGLGAGGLTQAQTLAFPALPTLPAEIRSPVPILGLTAPETTGAPIDAAGPAPASASQRPLDPAQADIIRPRAASAGAAAYRRLSRAAATVALAAVQTQAVFSARLPGQDPQGIVVGDRTLPAAPPPDHIRVKLARSEICNSDRRASNGTKASDLHEREIVMGHEGIGRIQRLPPGYADEKGLKIGDLVVLTPHYVKNDDPMLRRGLPNLSPDMRHLGIHLDGVFADLMDFPAYNVHKIDGAEKILQATRDARSYYDQMVMTEPLACVRRGYERLKGYLQSGHPRTVLILGAGPMGVMHAMHLLKTYPELRISLYDVDPIRRRVAGALRLPGVTILERHDPALQYDLVVPVTSDRGANVTDAPRLVRDGGKVLLFSGIDMKEGDPRPMVGTLDIEAAHRQERSVRSTWNSSDGKLKTIHFLGTSGYVESDIRGSIEELHEDFQLGEEGVFRKVQTTRIDALTGTRAIDLTGRFHDVRFQGPAIVPLLKLYDEKMENDENIHNYLKILIRH